MNTLHQILEQELEWSIKHNKTIRFHKIISDFTKTVSSTYKDELEALEGFEYFGPNAEISIAEALVAAETALGKVAHHE